MFWVHPNTEKKNSPIHSMGLFSTNEIRAEDIVAIAGGRVLSRQQVLDLRLDIKKLFPIIANQFFIQNDELNWPILSLNHCCDPNLYFEGHTVWRALRDIRSGEELTVDYGTFLDFPDQVYIENCLCGSTNCRTRITMQDWKEIDLQKKFKKHFNLEILKKIEAKR